MVVYTALWISNNPSTRTKQIQDEQTSFKREPDNRMWRYLPKEAKGGCLVVQWESDHSSAKCSEADVARINLVQERNFPALTSRIRIPSETAGPIDGLRVTLWWVGQGLKVTRWLGSFSDRLHGGENTMTGTSCSAAAALVTTYTNHNSSLNPD